MSALHDFTSFEKITFPNWVYNNERYAYTDFNIWAADWSGSHWEIPIVGTIVYVILIFGIKKIMENREPFDLKIPLCVWNIILSVFSGIGFIDVMPGLLDVISKQGISNELCFMESEVMTIFGVLFCWSKLFEFVDTIFIVLRKKPLIFLHWYHHICTMWFCWIALVYSMGNGLAFAALNLFVHTIMYGYYATTAVGMRWSTPVRKSITLIQISQMFVGIAVTAHNIMYCYWQPDALIFAFVMYASYVYLFIKLFLDNYVWRNSSPKEKKE